jgi:histidinol phosphatase-like enzyme
MTYVFDIDGTICTKTSSPRYEDCKPIVDRINKINELYDNGHTIIFHTARGMGRSNNSVAFAYAGFEFFTKKQLEDWGVKYHQLFLGKPSGDIYIDDKGTKDENFFGN